MITYICLGQVALVIREAGKYTLVRAHEADTDKLAACRWLDGVPDIRMVQVGGCEAGPAAHT